MASSTSFSDQLPPSMINAEFKDKIRQVKERMVTLVSERGMKQGLNFEPRLSDVIIVGYPKTGTTWMQQIVHQLRTGGDEDFEDLLLVVPLLEVASDLGQDLEAEQKAIPRCFKVHHWMSPKKGKYLVILRHPYSVAYSDYKYNETMYFDPGELSPEEFILGCWIPLRFDFLATDKSYFGLVASWYAHRHNPNVMFVFYEDLIEDLESEVRRIAKFMEINGEMNVRSAVEKSSFEYMKGKWEKFNSNSLKQARNKHGDLKETAGTSKKIRSGSTKEGMENLSVHIRGVLDMKWKEIVEPVTGFSNYEEFHKGMKSRAS